MQLTSYFLVRNEEPDYRVSRSSYRYHGLEGLESLMNSARLNV
jgi:hypothetical protein